MTAFAFLLLSQLAAAKSFTLIDDATKEAYVCTSVAPEKKAEEEKAGDPDCVAKITKLCQERGGLANSACFALATKKCKEKSARYADCARSTTQSCIDTSSGSPGTCLDRSLRECR